MIREGGQIAVGTAEVDALANTQFTTITQRREFTVRAVHNVVKGDGDTVTYDFKVGTLSLSKGVLSNTGGSKAAPAELGGLATVEDAMIYSGMIPPGNLFLNLVGSADGQAVQFDITGY